MWYCYFVASFFFNIDYIYDGQQWERSPDDESGYFTLKNPRSGYFLSRHYPSKSLTLEDGKALKIKIGVADGQVGNQICNDDLNHAYCNFDGGDCCLTKCVECVCSPNGIITSPRYPDRYSTSLDLTWLIQVPSGQLIEISFVYLLISNSYGVGSW